jgi:hypothetical protein
MTRITLLKFFSYRLLVMPNRSMNPCPTTAAAGLLPALRTFEAL